MSDPLQLISVLLIGTGIFLFDPQKIPETARAIGRVRTEFDAARKSFQQLSSELQSPAGSQARKSETMIERLTTRSTVGAIEQASVTPGSRSADKILIDTAHELRIFTQGRTREDISQEILAQIRATKGHGSNSSGPKVDEKQDR